MDKTLKINPPEGYEIDKEKSTFEEIVFKKSDERFPKTWEECVQLISDRREYCYFIQSDSDIRIFSPYPVEQDKHTVPTKELAGAILALEQLLLIRHVYNGFEEPDFNQELFLITIDIDNDRKFVISEVWEATMSHAALSFKDELTAQTFRNNFHDLILKAAPVL